jgi:hypothetical protein
MAPDIMASFETRTHRSFRFEGSLYAAEKIRVWLCAFDARATVIGFDLRGIRLLVS